MAYESENRFLDASAAVVIIAIGDDDATVAVIGASSKPSGISWIKSANINDDSVI
jgi:hypothetical protein